jgi:hypothetical protein
LLTPNRTRNHVGTPVSHRLRADFQPEQFNPVVVQLDEEETVVLRVDLVDERRHFSEGGPFDSRFDFSGEADVARVGQTGRDDRCADVLTRVDDFFDPAQIFSTISFLQVGHVTTVNFDITTWELLV